MRRLLFACCLLLPVLAFSACGSKTKDVNTASYTCAEFTKSLKTKGDNTAGNYINQLRKEAKLGQNTKAERSELTLGIYFACRNKPGSTTPRDTAIATAKKIKAGNFKLPGKKKSNN